MQSYASKWLTCALDNFLIQMSYVISIDNKQTTYKVYKSTIQTDNQDLMELIVQKNILNHWKQFWHLARFSAFGNKLKILNFEKIPKSVKKMELWIIWKFQFVWKFKIKIDCRVLALQVKCKLIYKLIFKNFLTIWMRNFIL